MKCDESRPTCTVCKITGFTCGGYGKSLYFKVNDDSDSGAGVARIRRPLLTMEEREGMSKQLVAAIPPASAMRHISHIDEVCEQASVAEDLQISRGPFGAFRMGNAASVSNCAFELTGLVDNEPSSSPEQEQTQYDDLNEASADLLPEELPLLPNTSLQHLAIPNFEPMAEISFTPTTDYWNTMDWSLAEALNMGERSGMPEWYAPIDILSSDRVHEISGETPISNTMHSIAATAQVSQNLLFPQIPPEAWTTSSQQFIPSPDSIAPSIDCAVPHDAVFLLKHYTATVLRGLTPFRHSRTPWHVLFIPHVKSCLAALTLDEEVDNASKCTFYGTLAISAYSLAGISKSSKWLQQGKSYQQQARLHIQLMLKTAYNVPKMAKYKSILMALLTMTQLSLLFGDRDQTEFYFLEAEKFIRLRGLGRNKKSRKVRLLHHCYAFERMIYESTVPSTQVHSLHRNNVRKAIESSDAAGHSIDGLSFRLNNCENLERAMLKVKCQEEGENDLHLEIPGVWSATLYPEIFGMPELHVFLLSLAIRLTREKNRDGEKISVNNLGLKEFLSRSKAVESCINRLHKYQEQSWFANALRDLENQQPAFLLDGLSKTMQHALAIYFYRKVYDLDSTMLQQNVLGVRDCLLHLDAADTGEGYGSLRLVWPAFIAACEADDLEVRASFSQWFENCGRRSGLQIFRDKQVEIEQVWRRREGKEGEFASWTAFD